MEKWFIRYKVKYDNGSGEAYESGILVSDNYMNAAAQIEDFYGPDLIEILKLKYLDADFLLIPEKIIDEIEKKVE